MTVTAKIAVDSASPRRPPRHRIRGNIGRRRHLHQEGSSFLQIKDHWRRDLAISLLAETTLAVAEIARRTGFSEPSTFHRAFKKWTGVQPSAYQG